MSARLTLTLCYCCLPQMFPLSTKYEGWYKIKEQYGHKKHDDKELYLQV